MLRADVYIYWAKNYVTAKYNELGEEIIHKKTVTVIQPKTDWKAK
jgi:hypothetical protein